MIKFNLSIISKTLSAFEGSKLTLLLFIPAQFTESENIKICYVLLNHRIRGANRFGSCTGWPDFKKFFYLITHSHLIIPAVISALALSESNTMKVAEHMATLKLSEISIFINELYLKRCFRKKYFSFMNSKAVSYNLWKWILSVRKWKMNAYVLVLFYLFSTKRDRNALRSSV